MIKVVLALVSVAFTLATLGLYSYGAYLAFSASVILGVVVLVVVPASTVLGVVGMFRPDVCEEIAKWMGLG